MSKKIMKMINQVIRRGSGVNLNLFRYAAMVIMLLTLGVGNAWGGSSYYTAFTATSSDTGKGLVYASGPGTSTAPANDEAYGASSGIGQSRDTGGSSKTNSYYAWAKAARGYAFNGWTISGSNGGVSPTSSSTQNGVEVKVTSNKEDGTNTGTATANWKDATSVTVTFGVPVDGSYTMTYSYTAVKDGKFATEQQAYSMTESSTAASGQIKSYAGDNVTVSTDATNFEGWYNNALFSGTALSTASSYNFTVSGATSIYAKFKSATKYYGKVAASIPDVPYSMPGGGTIYISNIAGTTGATFSENAQEAKITTFNSDATPPASMNQTFYLHAKPNDKRYTFRGWFNNEAGTGTALSTSEDWEYTFAVSSHTESAPTTKTVYAIFDFKLYYMQVEIEPAIQGQGMVLASETKLTNPEYGLFSSESSVLTYALRAGASGTNDVYVYAKPKYGYKLAGWYSDPECTIAASVASDGKYTATGSSIYPMDPTIIKLYAKFVEESKINVTYNNPDHAKGEYKAYALDIAEVNDEYVWSQTEIFSSKGKSANTVQSQYKTDVLILSAEAISGYGVTSWTDGSTTKTTPSQSYNTTATAAKTVGVTFGDAKPFKVGDNFYATFSEALTAVGNSGQITVVQNAYIPAGNYTIPSGVTLLVPFDDAYTLRTTDPTHAYAAPGTPSVYVKLTLGANAHLTVGGAISVSSTSQGNQPYGGCVYGKYGQIDMESGSTITLNSGANLYCWGYITGAGEITAKSGSKVYEDFQIACWRGGSAASSINGNSKKVFPLAQYYIQNIEAKLHVESGATEYVWTAVSANSKAQRPSGPITLISKSSGLFQVSSGSLTKWFDAVNDRQMYEIAGNTALGSVSMTVYIVTINSTEYVLPLTNNMDITIKSGTLSCSNDVAILPGASIRIDEGAKASITGDIFVYDKAEWPADGASAFNYNNVSFKKVNYTATPITNARTYAKMKDAILDVNGTFETNGKFYTTAGGADICSSKGTGIVKFTGTSGSASATYQATQSGTSISYTTIPVTAARLHNSDDSYTLTVGSVSGDKYIYNKNSGIWMKNPKTITWNANGGVGELTTTAYSEGSFLGELPAAAKDGYDLAGWYTTADGGTKISATTKVTATTTYYAHWTPKTYTITYKNQGESTFAGSTHIDTPNEHPTTHTFGTATTLNEATRTHFTFGGWYKTVSCTGTAVTSIPASTCKNITLYAKWSPEKYDITYKDKGNVAFSGEHGAGYPTKHTYGTATALVNPSKENYIFDGWYTVSDCSTGKVTSLGATDYSAGITLYAKWTEAEATVTVNDVTTNYATLQSAITAANGTTNATVKVLKGVTITSQIAIGAAMTIDLNGKTITSTLASNTAVFKIAASGKTITISDSGTDGKIEHTANFAGKLYGINLNAGSLNIDGGTIFAKNTANSNDYRAYAIYTDGSAGSITMSKGTLHAESPQMAFGIYDSKGCPITMTGGIVEASGTTSIRGIYIKGTTTLTDATITATATGSNSIAIFGNQNINLTIHSGTYTATGTSQCYAISERSGINITINGGRFSGATKELKEESGTTTIYGGVYAHNTGIEAKCATNYHVLSNADATYKYKVAEAYIVTFDANGHGSAPTLQLIEKGQKASQPAAPTETGYTFGGWYKEAGCTNAWNFASDVVTAATPLYAKWTANTHKLSWNFNGGTPSGSYTEANNALAYGSTITYPTLSKTGYTFAGWSSDATSMPDADLTITASWTINQYNLNVAANNAEWGTVSGGGLYDYNTAHTITATPKSGFKFVKWNDDNTNASREVTVTADVTYTATFDYDIANYTVKHWQQNISDDNYTEVTADQQVLSGTVGEQTSAVANSYTGFTAQPFSQQTIAVGDNNIVNIYYDRVTYTITWKDGQNVIESAPKTWRYGAKPSFDYQKDPTVRYTYTLTGWRDNASDIVYATDNLPNVTSEAIYIAQISAVTRQYTITFVNDDETTVLQSGGVDYGTTPAYSGKTPVSTISDGKIRIFKEWAPEVSLVGEDATYTAVYDIQSILEVPGEETISVNTTVNVTTVHVAGKLTVTSGTLTTTDLILEGSEGASGQLIGEVTATNAYFDLSHEGGFKARTWYAVAVPWQVEVPAYDKDHNGVYLTNDGVSYTQQELGRSFDLIYYNGAKRAAEGHSDACWQYIEDDAADKHIMYPGRAYMIYLTSNAQTIRFERKADTPLQTNTLAVATYDLGTGNNKDANWNGIANPATYHAYINANVDTYGETENAGQIYDADSRSYTVVNLSTSDLVVGQPVFVQATASNESVAANPSHGAVAPYFAPRRAKAWSAPLTRYELMFAPIEEEVTDRIIVRMDEDKEENAYVIGQDLVKMGVSDRVPQMWINRYDSKMCINTVAPVNNTADYPMGISVQKDGEYELFIDDQPNDETMLYLTYDGEAIWNLSYGGYVATLTKGENTHYGLRIVYTERKTPTGIEQTTIQNGESIRKVLVDDKVYIIRGNNVYSIDGQLVK